MRVFYLCNSTHRTIRFYAYFEAALVENRDPETLLELRWRYAHRQK